MTTPKVARRPKAIMRFYVEGRAVDAEAFYDAVRELGGQAVVTAHPPRPAGYTLTEKGAAALRPQEGREDA